MSANKPVAIVTGAGSGVGRASALSLAAAGFRIYCAGRRSAPLDETCDMAGDMPGDAIAVATDVGDADSVTQLFEQVRTDNGRLDFLFNNAGIGAEPVDIDELSIDSWRAVVDVNLNGVFYCAREAFRLMKSQDPKGGRILNNGSISAHMPRPNSAPYTATKHAVSGLTKALSLDGRPHNIACGQIDIGNAATDMTARMQNGVLQADGSIRAEPTIDVKHVANSVAQIALLPLDVNVQFMTIMATTMPYIGRG